MKRLRAGAYASGNYLIRYHAWLGESWDGPREEYKPWHVFRRASVIDNRTLIERTATLEQAIRCVHKNQTVDMGR